MPPRCSTGSRPSWLCRPDRDPGRRRGVGRRDLVQPDRDRVRADKAAVRPPDRLVPGDQAPVRPDALPGRTRQPRRHGTPRARPIRRRTSCRWRPPAPPRSRSTRQWTTPRTASRCLAGSGSPGNTTRTCTCAARWRCAACSAAPRPGEGGPPAGTGRRRRHPLSRTSARRSRGSRAAHGPRGGRVVAIAVSATPRITGATGWPSSGTQRRPGRRLTACRPPRPKQLIIDEELARAGIERPDLGHRRLGDPRDLRARHARSARPVRRADAARRDRLVPAVQRA